MNHKLIAFGAVLALLAFPLAVHAADVENDVRLRAYQDGLRLQIVSVLEQMMPLELACEADPICDAVGPRIRSPDLMRLYEMYSPPLMDG